MKYIVLLIKGFIIGVAKIIPGVSGAILSISFGVYEKLIEILANPLKFNFDDLKFLFCLFLGMTLGILCLCGGIKWFLNNFYFQTMLFFIGLIIGGIPEIIKELKFKKIFSNFSVFFISFLLILIITNLSKYNINGDHFFIMGSIESLTTIIPGISGTAIFMALGWYESLLTTIENILTFNTSFSTGFSFIFGFILMTVFISKFLTFIFRNYKIQGYYSVLGFMSASLLTMFINAFQNINSFIDVFMGFLLLILGVFSTIKMNSFFSKF